MKERLKEVRRRAGMTQTEFGAAIGATRAMISSYEFGAVVPSDTIIELICIKFHISRLWLTTGEGPMDDIDPEDPVPAKLADVYNDLPERFKKAVQVLMEMTPEWWAVLDKAFDEWESRQNDKGAGN